MIENTDLNFWLYLIAFLIWFVVATLWIVRIRIYIAVWNIPVPKWAKVITAVSCLGTVITFLRLVYGQTPWATTVVAAIWLVIAIGIGVATVFFRNRKE